MPRAPVRGKQQLVSPVIKYLLRWYCFTLALVVIIHVSIGKQNCHRSLPDGRANAEWSMLRLILGCESAFPGQGSETVLLGDSGFFSFVRTPSQV